MTAELDNICNIYEQPWCEIAERRATHKLIKILKTQNMYNPIGADSRAAYYNVLPNSCDNCSTCDLRIEIPLLIVLTDNGGNSYSLVQSMRGT